MVKPAKAKSNVAVALDSEAGFYADISKILLEGRAKAHTAVNTAMVETYWSMGKRIVEQEQHGKERAKYGEQLLANLSRYLGSVFGRGFSVANLWNFRQFFLTWPTAEILYTLCRELSWSHLRLIMRIDSKKAREYYLNEAREQGWSTRTLERSIKTGYYDRLLSTRKPKTAELQVAGLVGAVEAENLIKDPYVLEFLDLPGSHATKEATLEAAIISHLQSFLLELGRGFSFVASQFRISTETSHFYVDLVFYNYLLKCFIVIDLKTHKLTHQDIGQMDMYVRMFDDLKRGEGDSPTIGIILCCDKDETMVKYSVLSESRQLFASKYVLVLPTEEELAAELGKNTRYLSGMDGGGV